MCVLLTSCVSTNRDTDISTISSALNTEGVLQSKLITAFRQVCLSGGTSPERWMSAVTAAGNWQTSDDTSLGAAGLQGLRKLVLAIPGGGGRFDEEQTLYSISDPSEQLVLNLERRYTGEKTLSSKCEIYGRYDFLKTCQALGTAIGRPPDHNQRYDNRGAHFIRWDTLVKNKTSTISCETAPQSPTLGYDGISLHLRIDHIELQKLKANQPVSVVSKR